MMEADFRAILIANAALTVLVCDRVFFQAAPQDERRPRVLIRLAHYQHRTLAGANNDYTTQASIDVLANTYREACTLGNAVQVALQDVRFKTQGDTIFNLIHADNADDIPAMPQAATSTATFGRNIRARIEWQPRITP